MIAMSAMGIGAATTVSGAGHAIAAGGMSGGIPLDNETLLAIADHDGHDMTVWRVQGPPSLVLRCITCKEDVYIWVEEE